MLGLQFKHFRRWRRQLGGVEQRVGGNDDYVQGLGTSDWEAMAYSQKKLPESFNDDELLAGPFYDLRFRMTLANRGNDYHYGSMILCSDCKQLMLTVYRIVCGHYYCGPCAKKLTERNYKYRCAYSGCHQDVSQCKVYHGDREKEIQLYILGQVYINCPWKCKSDIYIKNIFEHELSCEKARKDEERIEKKTRKDQIEAKPVTSEDIAQLKEKYSESYGRLEAEIVALKKSANRYENEIRDLNDTVTKMRSFFKKYTASYAQLIGSKDGHQLRNLAGDSLEKIVAHDRWQVDLSPVSGSSSGKDGPQSLFHQDTLIDLHEFRANDLCPIFVASLKVSASGSRSARRQHWAFESSISLKPSDVDEFHQWPLRATAILKVMDGEQQMVERKKDLLADMPSSNKPVTWHFPAWYLSDVAECMSYLESGRVTLQIIILKNNSPQAGSAV